jgi:diguanylate cyclase (GGDEF)-like protein/PAS domain S-box-containing protein
MEEDFKFKDIIESAHDLIVVTKPDPSDVAIQIIVYVNQAFTELTEYSYDEVIGKKAKLLELFDDDTTRKEVREALEKKLPVRTTIKTLSKSRKEYWLNLSMIPLKDRNGELTYYASIERDVTNEIKLVNELENLSKTDSLTGLLNRRTLLEIAAKEISRYQRSGTVFCLLMLDLDHFKNINDTYGHAGGDKILQAVAELLKEQERPYDYAVRMGGEEFCILLSNTSMKQAYRFAERIKKLISEINIYEKGQSIKITTSIGISEVIKTDINLESTLKRADEALYNAKEAGRNCIVKSEIVEH